MSIDKMIKVKTGLPLFAVDVHAAVHHGTGAGTLEHAFHHGAVLIGQTDDDCFAAGGHMTEGQRPHVACNDALFLCGNAEHPLCIDAGIARMGEAVHLKQAAQATRKNSMVRTCISALTWETLAYLALNKKIVLDLTPCGECENDLCAAQLRKELTRLVDFFGQPMFEARFTLAYEPDEALYHVKELSRREMFEQVSHGSKSGTKKLLQMLPGLHSEDDGGVDFRLLLHQRTKQLKASMETPLKYGYYLPNFTDKCFGCGKCEKACRAGALKLEDLPDGQTRIVITPWKCSECEVCVASCSNHGIDGMKLRQLTTLGPVSVHKCTKTLCKECGKPIAPGSVDGVCTVCRIKARTKKRQEEAAARAEFKASSAASTFSAE